jgi:hypothetical protein
VAQPLAWRGDHFVTARDRSRGYRVLEVAVALPGGEELSVALPRAAFVAKASLAK